MKFLYDENQHYMDTHELFSQDEIKAHIDRYFKDSHYYFQSFVDREPLARCWGLPMMMLAMPLCVGAFFNGGANLLLQGVATPVSALSCVFLCVGTLMFIMGFMTLVRPSQASSTNMMPQKGKDKSRKIAASRQPKTKRELAYEDLLGRGRLYEGKIDTITDLDSPLREIKFSFVNASKALQSAVFVTESSVELAPYETLVVLSDGTFTVLL